MAQPTTDADLATRSETVVVHDPSNSGGRKVAIELSEDLQVFANAGSHV